MDNEKNLITNEIKPWNYEDSVKECKALVGKYDKISLQIVRELYAANQALSCSGLRSDLDKTCISDGSNGNLVPNGTRLKTFKDYLEEVGLARTTAFNWMVRYIPEEDRLMSTEEFKQRLIEHACLLLYCLNSLESVLTNIKTDEPFFSNLGAFFYTQTAKKLKTGRKRSRSIAFEREKVWEWVCKGFREWLIFIKVRNP